MPSVVEGRRRTRAYGLFVIALGPLLVLGCGDSRGPTAPGFGTGAGADAAALAGMWTGTVSIPAGTGTLRMTLAGPDREGVYRGEWSAVFPNASLNRHGILSAEQISVTLPRTPTLPGLSVSLALTSPTNCDSGLGEGPYDLMLFAVERHRMRGSGLFGGCDGAVVMARIELSR